MKYIYSLLAMAILLLSCGEGKKNSLENILASDNLLQLREKRGEVDAKKLELESQLKLIDDRILELDTIKKLPLVTTVKVEAQNFIHYLELQGNVQTKQNLVIYPEMGGILEHVYVK